ncbi:MAG: hypothetical protein H7831_09700, partial [Magnetococcus sp. WYHC-3]
MGTQPLSRPSAGADLQDDWDLYQGTPGAPPVRRGGVAAPSPQKEWDDDLESLLPTLKRGRVGPRIAPCPLAGLEEEVAASPHGAGESPAPPGPAPASASIPAPASASIPGAAPPTASGAAPPQGRRDMSFLQSFFRLKPASQPFPAPEALGAPVPARRQNSGAVTAAPAAKAPREEVPREEVPREEAPRDRRVVAVPDYARFLQKSQVGPALSVQGETRLRPAEVVRPAPRSALMPAA